MMVIEAARDRLGLKRANSSEIAPDTPDPVIDIMETAEGRRQKGRHDAPGRLSVRDQAGLAGRVAVSARRRSPNAIAIAMK